MVSGEHPHLSGFTSLTWLTFVVCKVMFSFVLLAHWEVITRCPSFSPCGLSVHAAHVSLHREDFIKCSAIYIDSMASSCVSSFKHLLFSLT